MTTPFGLICPGWPERVGNPNALSQGVPAGYSFSTFGGVPVTYLGAQVFDNGSSTNLSVRTR